MSITQAFISVLEEFLDELRKTFPEEKKLKVYYNSFQTMKKTNPKVILEGFMKEVSKHSDKIVNKDESYFLEGDDEFLKELNVKKWWTPDLSQNTKDAIWQYMNTLYILGTTITSIPNELLSTIENVAEKCASDMEQNPGQDANMSNLFAGVQNMVGNLMKNQK